MTVVDYESALRFLLGRVNYETFKQMPYSHMRQNLDRLKAFLGFLGRPDLRFPIIHVAGTKGKGSVCAIISNIVRNAGYRVGCFTSPHIHAINERFAVNGKPCSNDDLFATVRRLESQWHVWQMHWNESSDNVNLQKNLPAQSELTFFEWSIVLAFEYFSREQVDLVVLETGIGGRFDATNVCEPMLCVITSISFEHVEQLGHTLAAIAREKAGVVKSGVPVVSGVDSCEGDDPQTVIRNTVLENHAMLYEKNRDFWTVSHDGLERQSDNVFDFVWQSGGDPIGIEQLQLNLPGYHQRENASLALACVILLRERGWTIPDHAIREALVGIEIPCRAERLTLKHWHDAAPPTVIVDGAHNKASAEALLDALVMQRLEQTIKGRKILLFGSTLGKDVPGMLETLSPFFDEIWLSQYTTSPRGVPVDSLHQTIRTVVAPSQKITVFPVLSDALTALLRVLQTDDLLCATGSMYFAAEVRQHLLNVR